MENKVENIQNCKDLSREKRIKRELKRLSNLFEEIDGNRRKFIQPILENAAFMAITLQDLQEEINAGGVVDQYQNGQNQHGVKIGASLQAYNSLIKSYSGTLKTLSAILPREKKEIARLAWTPEEDPETPEECEARMKKEHEEFCRLLAEDRARGEITPEEREANFRANEEELKKRQAAELAAAARLRERMNL